MKIFKSIICITCLLLLVSCNPTSSKPKAKPKTLHEKSSNIKTLYNNTSDKAALQQNYQQVYEATQDDVHQLLGVTFLTNDEISFAINTATEPCDTYYNGKAKLYLKNDQKIYLDNLQVGVTAKRYFYDNRDYAVIIIISEDHKIAQINFVDKTDLDTDCDPYTNLLLHLLP